MLTADEAADVPLHADRHLRRHRRRHGHRDHHDLRRGGDRRRAGRAAAGHAGRRSRSRSRPTASCRAASRSATRSARSTRRPAAPRLLHDQLRAPDALRARARRRRRWRERIRGLRANASTKSHAELDEADGARRRRPGRSRRPLRGAPRRLPRLNVLGGCCGTDHRHVDGDPRRLARQPLRGRGGFLADALRPARAEPAAVGEAGTGQPAVATAAPARSPPGVASSGRSSRRTVRTRSPMPTSSRAPPITITKVATFSAK